MKSHPLELKFAKEGVFDIAGLDEAGRGPWAGPLVAAAVIFPGPVRLPGLDDSKKLTEIKRIKLFAKIIRKSDFGVGIVPNTYIDKYGLTKALNKAYKKALEDLPRQPKYVLIDGIGKYNLNLNYETIKHGDSKVRVIAAASIVAKVVRDTIMDSYSLTYKKYGFDKHKGYGTRQHHQNLIKYGVCKLHRKSYRPVKAVLNDSK